jgi:hypothetical protein
LEAITNKSWVGKRRGDPVYVYAERNWDLLRAMPGMGLKKIRYLVEILSTAVKR